MYHLFVWPHLRDYSAEIEAAVTAKLSSWKPQHLSLWVDLVEPPAGPTAVASAVEIVEMEDAAQAARFREVSAKLSQGIASMTAFNTASNETSRRSHVVNVMHQKAQMTVGKQFLIFALRFSNFSPFDFLHIPLHF